MASPAAKALADRQRHYDQLHHRQRLEWLMTAIRPDWLDAALARLLTRQSEDAIRDPGSMTRAVDLADATRLAELDAWAAGSDRLAA